MTRPACLLLAASLVLPAAVTAADDQPVVLCVPLRYKKYEDRLPNHLDVFRADGAGKKVGLKVSYGNSTDAFRQKATRIVVVIGDLKSGDSPRKAVFNGFGGGIKRLTTEYSVHYRADGAAKAEKLVSGTVWTDHHSPSWGQDRYATHLKILPEALSVEIGRALFDKVAGTKARDIRDPDWDDRSDSFGGTTSTKAYALERIRDRGRPFVKLPLDNKLPLTVGFESLDVVNAATGKTIGTATPRKKEAISVEKGRVLEVPFGLPDKFPKEDLMMRAHKFFVVVPD
jgi:hypothetical protein